MLYLHSPTVTHSPITPTHMASVITICETFDTEFSWSGGYEVPRDEVEEEDEEDEVCFVDQCVFSVGGHLFHVLNMTHMFSISA